VYQQMTFFLKRKVLNNRKIIVAVTGSVAAYKSIELVRELKKNGAAVKVVMTEAAAKFVTPLSLRIASENEVLSDVFSDPFSHIDLPQWADAMIVAPATANTLSKFYSASADDMVSLTFLSFRGPVIAAPAMNWRMYTDPIFQDRIGYLKEKGLIEVKPEKGDLACGEEGVGRMASISTIITETEKALSGNDLSDRKFVITAGPTREPIDPVRFISNKSSGKMGYALARNAFIRGADVKLIIGPSCIDPPHGVITEYTETAEEMLASVCSSVDGADVLIMAAAVSDYSPSEKKNDKIDKIENLDLKLKTTRDIINEISKRKKKPFIVGFSAETGDKKKRAKDKMSTKGMDMIIFNNVSLNGSGFDVDTNEVTIIDRESETSYPLLSKDEVAMIILDRISDMLT
jgi:phosphopantothenoylcysteine decarboxylase/phosphopantothenate--cysteine ligase